MAAVVLQKKNIYTNVVFPANFKVKDANGCIAEITVQDEDGTVCAEVGESGTVNIAPPPGAVFTGNVVFASYGTPTGTCHNYQIGSCHAISSEATVAAAITPNSLVIGANNVVFVDPCNGTFKSLYVEIIYLFVNKPAKPRAEYDQPSILIRKNAKWKAFPNPSSDGVFSLETPENVVQMQIFDAYGKLVLQPLPSEKIVRLDNRPAGIYFLKIKSADGDEQVLRLVKI